MVSIRDILRNRAYLGTYQRLGVRVPGTHPALVSPDDFRRVQERLSDRRTNFSPRTVSGFLLSGLVVCDNCGNRMIGVSRRQSWTRRSDGSEQVASYRYYQCESRTNQGICSYNTQRADELEEAVRRQLSELDPSKLATAGNDDAVISQWQTESRRLRERLHQIDRRLNKELEVAGRATRSTAIACAATAWRWRKSASRSKRSCATPNGAPSTTPLPPSAVAPATPRCSCWWPSGRRWT